MGSPFENTEYRMNYHFAKKWALCRQIANKFGYIEKKYYLCRRLWNLRIYMYIVIIPY